MAPIYGPSFGTAQILPRNSTFNPPPNGITGGYSGNNANITRAIIAFSAIAWYNSFETIFLVLVTFRKKAGLYFFSLLIASFAIIVYQIGAFGKLLQLVNPPLLSWIFLNAGWIVMIVGQSLVLYSRLHLITNNRMILRFVLWMIVIVSTILYVPTAVFTFGSNLAPHSRTFVDGYKVVERLQMTVFALQECIISVIYLVQIRRVLRTSFNSKARRLLHQLVAANVFFVVMDAALLAVVYNDLFEIETTLKGLIYSVKLKLELAILSQLVQHFTSRNDPCKTRPDERTSLPEHAPERKSRATMETYSRASVPAPEQHERGPSMNSMARHPSKAKPAIDNEGEPVEAVEETERKRQEEDRNNAPCNPKTSGTEQEVHLPSHSESTLVSNTSLDSIENLYPGRLEENGS